MNAFTGASWINPVYWSLATEFQYYFIIGIGYGLVIHRCLWIRGIIQLLCFVPFYSSPKQSIALVFHYLPLFMIGILCFQRKINLISEREFLIGIGAGLVATTKYAFWMPLIVLIPVMFIRYFPQWSWPSSRFIGKISYSLYLLHVPIGGRVINLFSRLPDVAWAHVCGVLSAFLFSIIAAYIFYLFVERFSLKLSQRISYRVIQ